MHHVSTFKTNGLGFSQSFLQRLPKANIGLIAAWIAVIIYAASNSIVVLLVSIGEATPIAGGRNAITFANLLLAGSLLSIIPIAIIFRRDLTRANFRRLTRREWGYVVVSSLLSSAITPGLFFYALAHTSVTNVVLISRIEPPLFLLATWLILNERFSCRALSAGLVALSGAVVMISLRDGANLNALGKGEWATVAATLSYIASTLVTRKSLRDIPIGLFSILRTLLGAMIYFGLACLIAGPEIFCDIFSPVLWTWIWIYTGIVIVLAQIAWNMALKYARAETLSLATSFSPLAAILIAMILLSEAPGPGFVPGAVIILFSIFLNSSTVIARDSSGGRERPACTSHQPEPSFPDLHPEIRRQQNDREAEHRSVRSAQLSRRKRAAESRRAGTLKVSDGMRKSDRGLGAGIPRSPSDISSALCAKHP